MTGLLDFCGRFDISKLLAGIVRISGCLAAIAVISTTAHAAQGSLALSCERKLSTRR
jgi:hypothetical protein